MAEWRNSAETWQSERARRQGLAERVIPFGVRFLDDAMRGIAPSDLVLVGAYSGAGKTQFCVNAALSALESGRKVHFFALEAEPSEIERRLKFALLSRYFHEHRDSIKGKGRPWSFQNWIFGDFEQELEPVYPQIEAFSEAFRDLNVFYRDSQFTLDDFLRKALEVENDTDLLIVDHIHYIDWDEPDNKALKEIAKNSRDLAQHMNKPVMLVSHLRKKDPRFSELCPGIDEFHGSSDITKIATKVITMGSGDMLSKTTVETFFRIPKCRLDGSVTRYIGKTIFDFTKGTYDDKYQIGRLTSGGKEFEPLDPGQRPDWAARPSITVP